MRGKDCGNVYMHQKKKENAPLLKLQDQCTCVFFETSVAWLLANDFICFPQEQAVAIKTLRESIHDEHRSIPRRFGEVTEVGRLLQVFG
jgi:hypothetical protein